MKKICFVMIVSLFASCSMQIVKKPAINKVKKIAIVTLSTNSVPYKVDPRGTGGGGLTGLIGSISNSSGDKLFGGTRLVEFGLEEFSKEISGINNWQVVPAKTLLASPGYKKFTEAVKANYQDVNTRLYAPKSVVPEGMTFVSLKDPVTSQKLQFFKEACSMLQVDAIAVINFDLGYDAGFSIGGMGSAVASVSASIRMINSSGEWSILSLDTKEHTGTRFKSEDSTPMVADNIKLDDKFETMLKDAMKKNIAYYTNQIKKELAEKDK